MAWDLSTAQLKECFSNLLAFRAIPSVREPACRAWSSLPKHLLKTRSVRALAEGVWALKRCCFGATRIPGGVPVGGV